MNGPGKYDDLCTSVRELADAEGAIVIIINGKLGTGFSVQAELDVIAALPRMLEQMAMEIRRGAQ